MEERAPESGFAEVNGTRLYYQSRGRSRALGQALLFVHGFTLDHRMWGPQAEALSAGLRVVTYDARGFGRSAPPGELPYRHCEDAAALCEHLGLSRVVAAGHSIGAHQALELAISRPDLCAGYAALCPSGLAGIPFPEEVITLFARLRAAAGDPAPGRGVPAARRLWSEGGWFATARESPALAAQLGAILADYSGWHWTHRNPAKDLEPPAAQRLGELRIPALVLTGGRDLAYNGAVGRALCAGIAGAVAVSLPHAGHMANLEDPAAVNSALADLASRALG